MNQKRDAKSFFKTLSLGFIYLFLILSTALALFLPASTLMPVFQVAEAREGVVIREILRSDNWILPLRHGSIIPSKPILFHWLSAIVSKLGIDSLNLNLRIVSLLASACLLILFFKIVSKLSSLRTAFISSSILATSYGYLRLSTDGRVDMLFNSLIISSILLWILELKKELDSSFSRKTLNSNIYAIGFLIGLSVLTKGPLGVVFPALICLIQGIFILDFRRLFIKGSAIILISILIALPWYLIAAINGGFGFVTRQLIFENIARFKGDPGITVKPFWFYFPHLFTQFSPYLPLFLIFTVLVLASERSLKPLFQIKARLDLDRKFLAKMALSWLVFGLLFLSLSSGKRRAYLVPLIPAFSIFTAICIDVLSQVDFKNKRLSCKNFFRIISRVLRILSLVLIFLFLSISLCSLVWSKIYNLSDFTLTKRAITILSFKDALLEGWILFLLSVVFSALSLVFYRFKDSLICSFIALKFSIVSLFFIPIQFNLVLKGITHGYYSIAEKINKSYPNEEVYFVKQERDESFDAFFYYLDSRARLVSPLSAPPSNALSLARRSWYNRQNSEFYKNSKLLFSGGRKVDDFNNQIVIFRMRNDFFDFFLNSLSLRSSVLRDKKYACYQ